MFGTGGGPQDSCQRDAVVFPVVGSAVGGGWNREREDGGFPRRRLHPTPPPMCEQNDRFRHQAVLDRGDSDRDTDHENEVNEYRNQVPVGRRRQPNHPVRVPTFDGKGSWGAYYLQFSRIAARNGWGEVDKLDKLIDSLRDKALEYLSHLGGETQNSFENLVKAMEGRLGVQVDKGLARRMLQELEQKPGESFEELADRARVLIREAFPQGNEGVAEDLGVDAFVKALSDKRVALTIMDKGPIRLGDAVTMARTIFGNQRVLNHKPLKSVKQVSFENESADEDGIAVRAVKDAQPKSPRKADDSGKEQNELMSGLSTLLGLLQNFGGGRRSNTCFNCGKVGHFRRNCPTNPSRSRSPSPKPGRSGRDKPSKNEDGGNAKADVSSSHS